MRPVGVWVVLWRVMERSCTEIEGGHVFYTPDMPYMPPGCHGALLLTNPSRHPDGDRAPGWRSTCGRWGVRERLWRVIEWSCTEMESWNVSYAPEMPLDGLR